MATGAWHETDVRFQQKLTEQVQLHTSDTTSPNYPRWNASTHDQILVASQKVPPPGERTNNPQYEVALKYYNTTLVPQVGYQVGGSFENFVKKFSHEKDKHSGADSDRRFVTFNNRPYPPNEDLYRLFFKENGHLLDSATATAADVDGALTAFCRSYAVKKEDMKLLQKETQPKAPRAKRTYVVKSVQEEDEDVAELPSEEDAAELPSTANNAISQPRRAPVNLQSEDVGRGIASSIIASAYAQQQPGNTGGGGINIAILAGSGDAVFGNKNNLEETGGTGGGPNNGNNSTPPWARRMEAAQERQGAHLTEIRAATSKKGTPSSAYHGRTGSPSSFGIPTDVVESPSRKSVASNQADQSGPGVLQQMLDALSTNLGLEGGTLDQKIAQLDAAPNKSQGDILMMRQLKFLTGIPKNMQPYYDSIVQLCVSMSDITKHTTVKSLFDTLAVKGDQASQRLPLLFVDEGSLVLFCASALWEMEAEVRPYAVDGDVLDNILPAVGFFHQYEIDCFYDEDDDDISLCVMWKENGDASSLVTFLQTLVADATKSIDLTGGHLVHLNGKESTRGHMIQSAEQVATLRGKYHKFVFNRLVFSGLDPVAWCGVAQQLQFNKCKFEDGAADHLFDAAMNYPALSLVFSEDYPFTHEESFKLLSKVDFENAPTLVFEGDDAACSFMGGARVSAFLTEIAAEVIGSNFDPKSWLKLKSFDIYGKGNAALGAIMKNAVKRCAL